ncbi:MAG: HEAT repeat domain-containing protein, partial [Candidatus Obscuribacterales bacterium]|nr:HEAT repeat domain-containing protein [Candidatus Obscuribacterales bacterium]
MRQIFAVVAGKLRRMTAGLRDKPDVQIDDYVLEHFLLYNGLVGSSPENQPSFKEVRNDIVQSINDGDAHELAIVLKLPPLWWEDRLEKIFAEIAAINKEGAIKCLMAKRPDSDITGDTTPLSHSNWQVRSNAARMLAFLDHKAAVPRLAEMLQESSESQPAAFCHIAYSLAKLGSDQARKALLAHLESEEDWFRVDAAGALSYFSLASVAADLMQAMLAGPSLDDYMALTHIHISSRR